MKPFFVLNVVDGVPGVMYEAPAFDEAVSKATAVAKEQCDSDEAAIREELENDASFSGVGFDVYIIQTED